MKVEHLKQKLLGVIYLAILLFLLCLLAISAIAILIIFVPNAPGEWHRPILLGLAIFLNLVMIATLAILNRWIAVSSVFGAFASLVFWAGWMIPSFAVAVTIAGAAAYSIGYEFPPPPPSSGGGHDWNWD